MTTKTIGIFPASGALGGSTYQHLLKLVKGDSVVLISRHPEKVPEAYTKDGVRMRKAAYESSPAELQAAFAGIDVLFLVSYPSHVHEYRVKVHIPAIDAAKRAGVHHVFYSSLAFAGVDGDKSLAVVMQAHLDTERHLKSLADSDPSFTYTAVREGLYAESYPIYTAFFNLQDPAEEILIPHDGSGPGVSWVKRDELGEATAKLIAEYVSGHGVFPYANGRVVLTGPRGWSLRDTVKVLSRAAGKEIKIRRVSVDEYVRLPQVLARFGSEENARSWATAWDAIRAGETAVVSPQLGVILGREPEAFDVVIRQ